MASNSNVVCVINCSAFVDLGDILSLTQKEGFYLTGMHTTRINKANIIDMFSKSISDLDYSLIRKKATKIFCHGPCIALSFYRHRARISLNSLLGKFKYFYMKNPGMKNLWMNRLYSQKRSFYQ
jgi:hypothetical protein